MRITRDGGRAVLAQGSWPDARPDNVSHCSILTIAQSCLLIRLGAATACLGFRPIVSQETCTVARMHLRRPWQLAHGWASPRLSNQSR